MTAARPFLLTLVRPAGYVHASALAEALEYLAHALRALGHPVRIAENELDLSAHNVIACAHLLGADAVAQLPPDAIILNSEPLVHADDWQFASGVYREVLARFHIWDYSHANLARLPHPRASVIPFWYRSELVRTQLPRSAGDRLLFYGVLTPRRRHLLEQLAARGLTVDVMFGCYGVTRDRAMRAALAVLNLHKHDDASVFEAIRCFHPLINEVPVISEDVAGDPTADAFRGAAELVPTDRFVERVVDLVGDRAAFRARAGDRTRAFVALDPLPQIRAAVERYLRDRAS